MSAPQRSQHQSSAPRPRPVGRGSIPKVPKKVPDAPPPTHREREARNSFGSAASRSSKQGVDLSRSAMEEDEKIPKNVYVPTIPRPSSAPPSPPSADAPGREAAPSPANLPPWETAESTNYAPRPRDVMRSSSNLAYDLHERAGLDKPWRPYVRKDGNVLSSQGVKEALDTTNAGQRVGRPAGAAIPTVPSVAEIGSPNAGPLPRRMLRRPASKEDMRDDFQRAIMSQSKTFSHVPFATDGDTGGSGGVSKALQSPTGAKAARRRKRASVTEKPGTFFAEPEGVGIVPQGEGVIDARRHARLVRGGLGHDTRRHVPPPVQPHHPHAHTAVVGVGGGGGGEHSGDAAFGGPSPAGSPAHHASMIEAIAMGGLGSPPAAQKRHGFEGVRGTEAHLKGSAVNVSTGYDPFFVPSTDTVASPHRRRLRKGSVGEHPPSSSAKEPPFGVASSALPPPPPPYPYSGSNSRRGSVGAMSEILGGGGGPIAAAAPPVPVRIVGVMGGGGDAKVSMRKQSTRANASSIVFG